MTNAEVFAKLLLVLKVNECISNNDLKYICGQLSEDDWKDLEGIVEVDGEEDEDNV